MSKRMTLSIVLIALALPAAAQTVVDGELGRLLDEHERLPVWVFLADKGGREHDQTSLDAAAELLTPRALARRSMRGRGGPLVDARDLPLEPSYLSRIEQLGLRIKARSRWLNAVSVVADIDAVARLAREPFVRHMSAVRRSAAPFPQPSEPLPPRRDGGVEDPIDYGGTQAELEQINVPPVHQAGNYGEGVIVGMLDTGFNTAHECLENVTVLGTWDFINEDPVVYDEGDDPVGQENHGTMTLSTLGGYKPGAHVGVAFGASFYLAKTEDTSQEVPAEEDDWVEGIEWLEAQGCDVVSSSLGYYDWYVFDDLDGNTAVTTIAADHAVALGVVVVNSAGNSRMGFGHIIAPADGDSVIAVGAVDADGNYSYFSSPGPTADGRIKPDVAARGQDNHVAMPGSYENYLLVAGTSLSCPLTAGVAALILSACPEATPMQVREALRQTADRADEPDNDYGWGILDAMAAVQYMQATQAGQTQSASLALSSWPNPFNPHTTLRFESPAAGEATLAIYDISGRLVARLLDGPVNAGVISVDWKGRDLSDRPLPGGVYLARLELDGHTETRKLLLLN